tara:strand:+ start:2544 stop:2702 length:159 start_codon:yes stop_codon:yes gene_type:complete
MLGLKVFKIEREQFNELNKLRSKLSSRDSGGCASPTQFKVEGLPDRLMTLAF